VRGVFHAAGVLDDTPIASRHGRFRDVLAPKVDGVWNPRADHAVDYFVLFLRASYHSIDRQRLRAANAFMDALAHDRRARGLPR
jgi:hypothetical protein